MIMLFHVNRYLRAYISASISEDWDLTFDFCLFSQWMLTANICGLCHYVIDNCYSSAGNSNNDCCSLSSCIITCIHQGIIGKFGSKNRTTCWIFLKWSAWQLQRYFGVSIDKYIVWSWCEWSSKDYCHITAALLHILKCNWFKLHIFVVCKSVKCSVDIPWDGYILQVQKIGYEEEVSSYLLSIDWSEWLNDFLSRIFTLLLHLEPSNHSYVQKLLHH